MKDFRIHKLLYNEVLSIYPELFKEIFKEEDDKQVPSYIYIGFLGEQYVGMMSAYLHDVDTIYIQYAGFSKEFKGYMAISLFRKVVEYVHKDYKNIIFRIENTNIAALKVAMNTGFIIIGTRLDGIIEKEVFKGKLYIELVKNRGE